MWINLTEEETKLAVDAFRVAAEESIADGYDFESGKIFKAHNDCADRIERALNRPAEDDLDRKFTEAAAEKYSRISDGDLDWDDFPAVSRGDEGAYVMGWLWVSNGDAGVDTEEEKEEEEE